MRKRQSKVSESSQAASRPVLLDTHIAIWLRQRNSRIKPSVLSRLEECFHARKLCLSPISAWEISMLVSKQRLNLGQPPLVWLNDFVEKFNITLLDLTPEVAINSSFLPGRFHGDPADRMLVATALAYNTAIVTADANLISYRKQGFIEIVST